MDAMVELYIQDNLHPDLADEVLAACELFDQYDLRDYQLPLFDIIMTAGDSAIEETYDRFINHIKERQRFVIQQHGLVLHDDITFSQLNALLSGFLLIQNLENYTFVLTTLESDAQSIDKLLAILQEVTMLSEEELFPLIASFPDSLLDNLKKYAYNKSLNTDEIQPFTEEDRILLSNYKLFRQFIGTRVALGFQMLSAGVLVGQSFATYLPFITEHLNVKDKTQAALDLLSILLLSKDGYERPLMTFRDVSKTVFDNVHDSMRVDTILTQGIGEFETYKQKLKIEGQSHETPTVP